MAQAVDAVGICFRFIFTDSKLLLASTLSFYHQKYRDWHFCHCFLFCTGDIHQIHYNKTCDGWQALENIHLNYHNYNF